MADDLLSVLEPLVAMMDSAKQVIHPPFDGRLLESFEELKLVAHRYQDSPYSALKDARSRWDMSIRISGLIYNGFFDKEFGIAELDVFLEYADNFRDLVTRATSVINDYYNGFAKEMTKLAPHCKGDADNFFENRDFVRHAHLLALSEDGYKDLRQTHWDLQTILAQQDFHYFPRYEPIQYVKDYLTHFFIPEPWWGEVHESLPILKMAYDDQTAVDVAEQYVIRSS